MDGLLSAGYLQKIPHSTESGGFRDGGWIAMTDLFLPGSSGGERPVSCASPGPLPHPQVLLTGLQEDDRESVLA